MSSSFEQLFQTFGDFMHLFVSLRTYLAEHLDEVKTELMYLAKQADIPGLALLAGDLQWIASRKLLSGKFSALPRNTVIWAVAQFSKELATQKRLQELLALQCEVTEDLTLTLEWLIERRMKAAPKLAPMAALKMGLTATDTFHVQARPGTIAIRRSGRESSDTVKETKELLVALDWSITGDTLAEIAQSINRVRAETWERLVETIDHHDWVIVPAEQLEKERLEAEKAEARTLARERFAALELDSSERSLLLRHPEVVADVLAELEQA
jgi:hypothetical protein